jgi:hypothetical protein
MAASSRSCPPDARGEKLRRRSRQERLVGGAVGGKNRQGVEPPGLPHDFGIGHCGAVDLNRGLDEKTALPRARRKAEHAPRVLPRDVNTQTFPLRERNTPSLASVEFDLEGVEGLAERGRQGRVVRLVGNEDMAPENRLGRAEIAIGTLHPGLWTGGACRFLVGAKRHRRDRSAEDAADQRLRNDAFLSFPAHRNSG